MPDTHLFIGPPILKEHQGWEEPVHALEHGDALGDVCVQDFKGTASVQSPVMGHHPAESVGYLRLRVLEPGVFPPGAYSRDHRIIVYVLKQEIEVFGSGLEIRVDVADKLGFGIIKTCFQRGRKTGVLFERYIEEVLMTGTYLLDSLEAPIFRPIIHEQDASLLEHSGKKAERRSSSLFMLSSSLNMGIIIVRL